MKTLEQYGGNYAHLCIPNGLAVNNDRDFVLESPIEHHPDITIHVVPETVLDNMYESVMVGRRGGQKRHTRKKRPRGT